MKRVLAIILVCIGLVGMAHAETVDLSGMSYDELVALKDQINLAIWNSSEWQEVEVPQGVWVVGEDIPAGKWTIKAVEGYRVAVYWGDDLNEAGTDLGWDGDIYESAYVYSKTNSYYDLDELSEITWDLKEGQYVVVEDGIAVFSPYSGKASLGFK